MDYRYLKDVIEQEQNAQYNRYVKEYNESKQKKSSDIVENVKSAVEHAVRKFYAASEEEIKKQKRQWMLLF